MKKIVLASSNPGKIHEIKQLLAHLSIELIAQSEYGISDIEETGSTFFENAIIKARHAAKHSGLPALADDSGLAVTALNGKPGIYSSRYAGDNATDVMRIEKLLNELKHSKETDRNASFHCVLALMRSASDPAPIVAHGVWHGHILQEPRGEKGFGYDPIFYVPSHDCSAAELDADFKNQISHRGIAMEKFLRYLHEELLIPSSL